MGALSFVFQTILTSVIASSINYFNNERQIQGKTVAITGAAQGIGYAIADNFLKNGAKVVIILDINVQKGKEAEAKLNYKYGRNKTEFIECDVTKDVKKVANIIIEKYKYVDIFVNNAGINDKEYTPRKVMLTNAVGTIEFSLKFAKFMSKEKCGKGGTIINISSGFGHEIDPFFVTYKASKFASLGFSRSLGQEYNYNKTGVRVLTLCPGLTNTSLGLSINTLYSKEDQDDFKKFFGMPVPQSPDSVGRAAIDIFKNAKTGTSWDAIGGKSPFETPDTITVLKEKQKYTNN